MTLSRISELGVTFFKAGGHKHDGLTSSLIDTTKYSIFDFDLSTSTGGADVNREVRRQANRTKFDQYIARYVSSQVLEPAGIVLPADSVRGVNIGANEISANNIRANTITANEIAANTITAELLVTDFAIVNTTIRSNNFTYNPNTGVGTGWAIYGNGQSIFVDGIFSGEIDIGGNDATSFHVDTSGNVWSGSASYIDGKFKVSATGDVEMSGNLLVKGFKAVFDVPGLNSTAVRVEGVLEVRDQVITGSLYSDGMIYGDQRIAIYDQTYGALFEVNTSSLFASENGATDMKLRRVTKATYDLAWPSNYQNQMLQLWNNAESYSSGDGVCGISLAVGFSTIGGAVLRAWPAGGAVNALAMFESGGAIVEGTWTQTDGFDVGTLSGQAYAFVGASAFVVRSSAVWKDNVEYMPKEDRGISVDRIRQLKPARWDDKAGFQQGYLSERFKSLNERWVAKGRKRLVPQDKHYEFRVHDCEIDQCIGGKDSPCSSKQWHEKRYGFIAEDVAEVFPKATQFDGSGHPIGIDYAVITYGLVETTQHLLDKIEDLEAKISELQSNGV